MVSNKQPRIETVYQNLRIADALAGAALLDTPSDAHVTDLFTILYIMLDSYLSNYFINFVTYGFSSKRTFLIQYFSPIC